MTNRERFIKDLENMSDYELARFIDDYVALSTCYFCIYGKLKSCDGVSDPCDVNVAKWLKKEVDESDGQNSTIPHQP